MTQLCSLTNEISVSQPPCFYSWQFQNIRINLYSSNCKTHVVKILNYFHNFQRLARTKHSCFVFYDENLIKIRRNIEFHWIVIGRIVITQEKHFVFIFEWKYNWNFEIKPDGRTGVIHIMLQCFFCYLEIQNWYQKNEKKNYFNEYITCFSIAKGKKYIIGKDKTVKYCILLCVTMSMSIVFLSFHVSLAVSQPTLFLIRFFVPILRMDFWIKINFFSKF